MKTVELKDLSIDLTEGQLKAIALKQFNNETNFFCIEDEENDMVRVIEEEVETAKSEYLDRDEKEKKLTFEQWAVKHLYEIDEIDGDNEKDNYIVLTDDEANEKAKEYILDSVWAFNADFIIDHASALDHSPASYKIVEAIREQYESGNDAMLKLIDNDDEFIEDAISADGRGHFLNTYDGNENEETVCGQTFYIYRMN